MNWSLKLKEVNNRFRIQNLVTNQDIWWTSTINNELHTCKTHLFTYTFKIYHIIKTLARRWQITGRELCTGFFFFCSLFPMRKILKETNYVTGSALITSHCFLLLFLLRWKKSYKKGCSTIMILLIFRRENSYDWILDDKNNQVDDILTYKAVNNN